MNLKHIITTFVLCVSVAGTAMLSWADAVQLKPDHPEEYTVLKGDTLWDISNLFLKDPWLWPEIWHINTQIENPHLIFPGDVIALIMIDGQPKLMPIKRGDASRTVKLSPQKRISPIDSAIPAIPLDAISSFLSDNRVVSPETYNKSGYILASSEGRVASGAGDLVYGRLMNPDDYNEDITFYGVYRKGDFFIDPITKENLGLEIKSLGLSQVKRRNKEILTLELIKTKEEVLKTDRLLPPEDRKLVSTFIPSAPEQDVDGLLINVLGGVSTIGQYNVVVINKGEREAMKVGNVLAIYQKGETVNDEIKLEKLRLPSERAGLLMIFRVFEKVSFGLVLKSDRVLKVGDEVKNP